MAIQKDFQPKETRNKIYRDQLVTIEDLSEFRNLLLEDLKEMLNSTSIQSNQWLKSSEVTNILKISSGTLQTLRINGTLKFKKVGGLYYYSYKDIQKMLNQ
jgi:hypothetical protein